MKNFKQDLIEELAKELPKAGFDSETIRDMIDILGDSQPPFPSEFIQKGTKFWGVSKSGDVVFDGKPVFNDKPDTSSLYGFDDKDDSRFIVTNKNELILLPSTASVLFNGCLVYLQKLNLTPEDILNEYIDDDEDLSDDTIKFHIFDLTLAINATLHSQFPNREKWGDQMLQDEEKNWLKKYNFDLIQHYHGYGTTITNCESTYVIPFHFFIMRQIHTYNNKLEKINTHNIDIDDHKKISDALLNEHAINSIVTVVLANTYSST